MLKTSTGQKVDTQHSVWVPAVMPVVEQKMKAFADVVVIDE